jgi:hypothetical protein
MKRLKPGQLCTINGHVFQVKEGSCDNCSLRNKDECSKGQIDCVSIIGTCTNFKLIK